MYVYKRIEDEQKDNRRIRRFTIFLLILHLVGIIGLGIGGHQYAEQLNEDHLAQVTQWETQVERQRDNHPRAQQYERQQREEEYQREREGWTQERDRIERDNRFWQVIDGQAVPLGEDGQPTQDQIDGELIRTALAWDDVSRTEQVEAIDQIRQDDGLPRWEQFMDEFIEYDQGGIEEVLQQIPAEPVAEPFQETAFEEPVMSEGLANYQDQNLWSLLSGWTKDAIFWAATSSLNLFFFVISLIVATDGGHKRISNSSAIPGRRGWVWLGRLLSAPISTLYYVSRGLLHLKSFAKGTDDSMIRNWWKRVRFHLSRDRKTFRKARRDLKNAVKLRRREKATDKDVEKAVRVLSEFHRTHPMPLFRDRRRVAAQRRDKEEIEQHREDVEAMDIYTNELLKQQGVLKEEPAEEEITS